MLKKITLFALYIQQANKKKIKLKKLKDMVGNMLENH